MGLNIDFGTIKQASQPTLAFVWPLADGHSPSDFSGFTITAQAKNVDTWAVTAVTGAFVVTDGTTRACTWAMSAADTGTAGSFQITLYATDGVDSIYTLFGSLEIEVNPAVTAVAGPAVIGVPQENADWLADGLATVPDATNLVSSADIATKQDTVPVATEDNFASWNAAGQTKDSGDSAASFDTAGSAATAQAFAIQRANHTGTQLLATISDAGTMAAETASDYIPKNASILSKSSNYTLAAGDEAKIIECDGTFTITAPDSLSAGFRVDIVNIGTGAITISASTTLQFTDGKTGDIEIVEQYGKVALYHRGSNIWLAKGDIFTGLKFTSSQATITPSITRASGAPAPAWTIIESDGTEFIYVVDSFSHTRTATGNQVIRLAAPVLPYVTALNMNSDGLMGTLDDDNFLSKLPNIAELRLQSNSALVCDFALADLPASVTHLYLYSTSSTITGALADLPASVTQLHLGSTSSTITGALADLPASVTYLHLGSTSSTITGALADLPASVTYLYLYSTSSTITGGAGIMAAIPLRVAQAQDTSVSSANIDDILLRLYTDRASFTYATPSLNVGGANPAPSGTYQYAAAPSTGKEYIYALVNDDDGEGFNKWTITFSA